jgi:hypothetical protein
MPRGQRLKALSNTVDDTWTWTSRRSHLVKRHFMNATCDGERPASLWLTDDRLCNQARDRARQPHEARDVLGNAEGKQEGCPVSSVAKVRRIPGLRQSLVSPELDCPGNLRACHGYTEIEQIERREATTLSIHFSSRDCGPAS